MILNDLPLQERPREKVSKFGVESLSNAELLAIILRTGIKGKSIIDFSYEFLSKCNGLDGLAKLSYQDLIKIKGIKSSKATIILAVIEFAKRINYRKQENVSIKSSENVFEIMEPMLRNLDQESFYIISLTKKNLVIKISEIFKGGIDKQLIDLRYIFKEAIIQNAYKIILVHNHPGGDINPSKNDIETTKDLLNTSKEIGIRIVDHVIISKGCYFSFRENNLIPY